MSLSQLCSSQKHGPPWNIARKILSQLAKKKEKYVIDTIKI